MAWEVTCADVVEWAKGYTGPQFHAALMDPPYSFSKRKKIDRSARIILSENPAIGQILDAYHSIQQWGNTGMMGRAWDSDVAFNPATWAALAEHMLPGAFGLAFASARGWHRMAVAIEDAGLVIHPTIFNWNIPALLGWAYGQGWPKGVRIRNGTIPKEDRPVVREVGEVGYASASTGYEEGAWSGQVTGPVTDIERVFEGHRYGLQTLKPALEPIVLFQKPYGGRPFDVITGTGAGALWIDGGRIAAAEPIGTFPGGRKSSGCMMNITDEPRPQFEAHPLGRVPANLVITHRPECRLLGTRQVKNTSGSTSGDEPSARTALVYGEYDRQAFTKHGGEDGIGTIEDWECMKGGVVETECLVWNQAEITPFDPVSQLLETVEALAGRLSQSTEGLCSHTEGIHSLGDYDSGHALGLSKLPSFRVCCPSCRRLYDALAQTVLESALASSQQLAGAQIAACRYLNKLLCSHEMSGHARQSSLDDSRHAGQHQDILLNNILDGLAPCDILVETFCHTHDKDEADSGRADRQYNTPESKKADPGGLGEHKRARHSACIESLCRIFFVLAYKTSSLYLPLTVYHKTLELASCPVHRMGEQHGHISSTGGCAPGRTLGGNGIYGGGDVRARFQYGDNDPVTRYFQCPGWALEVAMQLAATDSTRYVTKAGKPERHAGLEGFFWKKDSSSPTGYVQVDRETWEGLSDKEGKRGNVHPTIKPVALTLWLARLLLPPASYGPRRLLVPFSGSGSEIIGAVLAGWEHITGIELLDDTARFSRPRIAWWEQWADALGITDPAEILAEYRKRKAAAPASEGQDQEVIAPPPRRQVEQMGLWE